jgi:hypothetical protein
VIRTLVASDPRAAQAIAEGALMRLAAGARCFERYRRHFGLKGSSQTRAHAMSPVAEFVDCRVNVGADERLSERAA